MLRSGEHNVKVDNVVSSSFNLQELFAAAVQIPTPTNTSGLFSTNIKYFIIFTENLLGIWLNKVQLIQV